MRASRLLRSVMSPHLDDLVDLAAGIEDRRGEDLFLPDDAV